MKRALVTVSFLLVAACKPSSTGTSTPVPSPALASPVVPTLTAAASSYKAEFRKEGGIASPLIPLILVVRNTGAEPWKCDGAITVIADGERGKTHEARTFLTTLSPCALAPGAEHREELEAGEFLTEVAGRHMKGDRLAVRALMAPSAPSAPVSIDVFVPEG
jgi:hypothetical protein